MTIELSHCIGCTQNGIPYASIKEEKKMKKEFDQIKMYNMKKQ